MKVRKIIAITLMCLCVGCADTKKKSIVVFHAGSLSPLFKECKAEFEKRYDYTVLLEASGSVDAARKIVDLNKQCDVIALADALIFESLLQKYCDYWIGFAGNEMVLAYSKRSRYARHLAENWIDALQNHPVTCTRSDPMRDPCGYRTLLLWKLAAKLYNNPQIETICAQRSPQSYMRPKEIDTLALVETDVCDAVWIYKSLAVERNLPFIQFDDRINLSTPQHNTFYQKACVTLKDSTEIHTFCGNAIMYGVSIPKNAGNTEGAAAFIRFLLSAEGKQLIQKHGLRSVVHVSNYTMLPKNLQAVIPQ